METPHGNAERVPADEAVTVPRLVTRNAPAVGTIVTPQDALLNSLITTLPSPQLFFPSFEPTVPALSRLPKPRLASRGEWITAAAIVFGAVFGFGLAAVRNAVRTDIEVPAAKASTPIALAEAPPLEVQRDEPAAPSMLASTVATDLAATAAAPAKRLPSAAPAKPVMRRAAPAAPKKSLAQRVPKS